MISYITTHPYYKEGMPKVVAIKDYIKKLSLYDKVAASAFGIFLLVGVTSPLTSPILVSPFLISSLLKTAWHAAQFFRLQYSLPPLERNEYMKKERVFTKPDLELLEKHLLKVTHLEKMELSFKNSKTLAKGLIPVIGVILWMTSKNPPTSLKPSDTWTDFNALKYHISYLKWTHPL